MTTKLSNPAISRVNSLNVQEPYLKVNRSYSPASTAHTLKEYKEGYVETSGNLPNRANSICPLPISKDTLRPREPVSIDFAVDQWFRILLVQMQKQSVSLLDDLAVPIEAITVKINI